MDIDQSDPRMLEVLEQMLRKRHEHLADHKVSYRRVADRHEAARAAEAKSRAAWHEAQAELAAAQRELDQEWEDLDRLSRQVDGELRGELLTVLRGLRERDGVQ